MKSDDTGHGCLYLNFRLSETLDWHFFPFTTSINLLTGASKKHFWCLPDYAGEKIDLFWDKYISILNQRYVKDIKLSN